MDESLAEIEAFKEKVRARIAQNGGVMPSVQQQREAFETEHAAVPIAEGCVVEPINQGDVRGERIIPDGADRHKALLYHHGGGHVFGSALSHRHMVSRLAKAARVIAYNMDYPLAPERPFPAALDSAVANWRFVLKEGFSASDVVVGGESAGGNLTAALLLKLGELGRELPAGAYLLSPWLDMTQSGETYETHASVDPAITRDVLNMLAGLYCGGSVAANDPLVSPLYGDLTGLPPIMVQVGGHEVLLSDSTQFADRAARAGVDVSLRVWPANVHAWPVFHHEMPLSGDAAIKEAARWISDRLTPRFRTANSTDIQ